MTSKEGLQQMAEPPEITEGKAKIKFSRDHVFYNPVQILNRDLSIAVINEYANKYWKPEQRHRQKRPFWLSRPSSEATLTVQTTPTSDQTTPSSSTAHVSSDSPSSSSSLPPKGLRILEGLAASGLRSIRYALEVPSATSIIANDISQEAYESIVSNVENNGVGHIVNPSCSDASMLMYNHRDPPKRFDVIDIDPYGSPTIFLDSVVQSCNEGGLLCITCTDASILCGNHSETCYAKYGSVSLKAKYCHEMALRIILASLNSYANRYRRYIYPLVSVSVDFYCRVFVLVYTSPAEVKKSASKLSMVYHCEGCDSFHLQPLGKHGRHRKQTGQNELRFGTAWGPPVDRKCEHCGSNFKFGGPIWSDPIHDTDFIKSLIASIQKNKKDYASSERMIGLLSMMSEELPDVPLYHVLDQLCSVLHCTSMKLSMIRSAILNQGYRVSVSHTHANAIKTDAPHGVIWDIMREWVKMNPVKNVKPSSVAGQLLSKEPSTQVSFTLREDADPLSRHFKLVRFPENPEPFWGPKSRAKRKTDDITGSSCASKKDKTDNQ